VYRVAIVRRLRRNVAIASWTWSCLVLGAAGGTGAQERLEGPPPSAPAAAPAARSVEGGTVALEVPGRSDWAATGLWVKRGDTIRVRAWGRIKVADANGNFAAPGGLDGFEDPLKLVKDAPSCALIAVIGDSDRYVAVGREAEFVAEADGPLFLGINQHAPEGNTGEFQVRVTVGEKGGLSFGPPAGALSVTPEAGPASRPVTNNERLVHVPGGLDWTNTAVAIKAGDTVTVEASGSVVLDLSGTACGPEGIGRPDGEKLIGDRPTGALIAVIGDDNNDFVYVGARSTFTAARSGLLFLGVNEGDLTNNSGAFSARVVVSSKR
jgi:hypothetical protein